MAQIGLERIPTQIWVHRHSIGFIPLESLERITLGGVAHIATLGVEDDRYVRMVLWDVTDEALELRFRAVGRVVRELRLEGTYEVRRGIDDRPIELEDRIGACELRREPLGLRVQADAKQ